MHDGTDLIYDVVVPGRDKVDWRLAKHAITSVNGFADLPSVQVCFAVSALLCEHGNVVRSNLSGVRTESEGFLTTKLSKRAFCLQWRDWRRKRSGASLGPPYNLYSVEPVACRRCRRYHVRPDGNRCR